MTIACLLRNTVRAACAQKGIAIPEMWCALPAFHYRK
jgi:hypothetical protein